MTVKLMKRKLTLNKQQVDRIERDIAPPMALAITLPVSGTIDSEIAVYVAMSPFRTSTPDAEDMRLLMDVARRLQLRQRVGR